MEKQEPITRSRFIECPSCKNRSLKLKRIVEVGRCRDCHESYKIVTVYVKTGMKTKAKSKPSTANIAKSESTLPSWQMPTDASLFGTGEPSSSAFSSTSFDWSTTRRDTESKSAGED